MSSITLILPHQLFEHNPALCENRHVYLLELAYFFTRFTFHKQKLIFHYGTLEYYYHFLKEKKYITHYFTYLELPTLHAFIALCEKNNITEIHVTELIELELIDELYTAAARAGITVTTYPSPMFMTPQKELVPFFTPKKKRYVMYHFYVQQRKRYTILFDNKQRPLGGLWSFDEKNRQRLPKTYVIPDYFKATSSSYTTKATQKVETQFANNPGSSTIFEWPLTHYDAKKVLHDFLEHRLAQFGPYQDAISTDNTVLFHSRLSALLNNGFLTPEYIVRTTLAYGEKNNIQLQSLEGFIRQIIGWREFVYGMYLAHGKHQKQTNYFHHTKELSVCWWKGTTGIKPVDLVIERVLMYAYAHHIERLMILGNCMLITAHHPTSVYRWFMELFIDAYDWVMVPNVYGMSQFADGGLMATKPYISSSAYIKKMSNIPKGDWEQKWDALFWLFLDHHSERLKHNNRLSILFKRLATISPEKLKAYRQIVHTYKL